MADLLQIGEAAKALGVTPKALRFYEKRGILPPAQRNGARYRLYAPEDLERVRFLLRAKAMGLGLEEAAQLLVCAETACCGATGPKLEQTLRGKLKEVEGRLRELKELRKRVREALASVEATVARNSEATSCGEEICLPGAVKDEGHPSGRGDRGSRQRPSAAPASAATQ